MNDKYHKNDKLIREYKEMLRGYIEKRPSGLRKKIAGAIGTNRSFVSQITNPAYRVPIPLHYVHTIISVCHLSPIERTNFLAAYMAAHPEQAELINYREASHEAAFTIDLSVVSDEQSRNMIKHALKTMADTMIPLATTKVNKQ